MKRVYIVDQTGTLEEIKLLNKHETTHIKREKIKYTGGEEWITVAIMEWGMTHSSKTRKTSSSTHQKRKKYVTAWIIWRKRKDSDYWQASRGRGKTTTVRAWASTFNSSLYKVVYIPLSTTTVQEFYRQLASGLGAEPAFRKVDNFRAIQDTVIRYALEKKITPVIILDEANYMSNGILNNLKLLFNFSMDSRDRAVVLLTGLPQLNNILSLNVQEPLRQRIIMNYDMDGLSKEEAKEYVLKKMERASCRKLVFEESALEAVINCGNGTMRIVNRICENCLLLGYHEK